MLNEKIMGSERELASKMSVLGESSITQEYSAIVEALKQELNVCKAEQTMLRTELECLRKETKSAGDIAQECFSHGQWEGCNSHETNKEMILNLQKRIAIVQMEKDSVFQLWQMALKAVDILEEELKVFQKDGKGGKCYEEQVNSIKETYSEAIKALEIKLVQAKENFLKHQSRWESCRNKIEALNKEKNDIAQKYTALQKDALEREKASQETIESLRRELNASQFELQRSSELQVELEEQLRDAKRIVSAMVAKDDETKNKVSEAIELVESAVREKDMALAREARVTQEKSQLENKLTNVPQEYNAWLQVELSKMKETYERNTKKYMLEIKELKAELRQKGTLLDRAQRECRLVEEELDKVRNGSDDYLHRSNSKILDLEQRLKDTEFKLETCEDACRKKYEVKIQQLQQQLQEAEEKITMSEDRLRRIQMRTSRNVEDRIKEAEERTKEAIERYSNLERRLARTLDERENLAQELRSLQSAFDREIQRRDHERRSLENRVRELQIDLKRATDSMEQTSIRGNCLADQIHILEQEVKKKHATDRVEYTSSEKLLKPELTDHLKVLQEKSDKRIKELMEHVEIHQRLSKKWKEEAKSIAASFQRRSKELKSKLNALRKENEELNRELLGCRQQLARCRVEVLHRYDQGDGTR
ncbi:nucleoprotein TPR [Cephus cinctus]|uniref:Nucleoprotein TPR n=1 Tax=Cephus cinctus TaxID=211228 RepID=A0AAJ7FI87_CEPCN|nr:nucleoprotein TPR [Cephus cinctus]